MYFFALHVLSILQQFYEVAELAPIKFALKMCPHELV